jgi:hypothetical protein
MLRKGVATYDLSKDTKKHTPKSSESSVADPEPGYRIRCFLPLRSGIRIRDEFFSGYRIRPLFWWNFLTLSTESLPCYLYKTGVLLKLTPETISSMKNYVWFCYPFLNRTSDPGSEIPIRDEKILGSGMNSPDPQHCVRLSINVFCEKI